MTIERQNHIIEVPGEMGPELTTAGIAHIYITFKPKETENSKAFERFIKSLDKFAKDFRKEKTL